MGCRLADQINQFKYFETVAKVCNLVVTEEEFLETRQMSDPTDTLNLVSLQIQIRNLADLLKPVSMNDAVALQIQNFQG